MEVKKMEMVVLTMLFVAAIWTGVAAQSSCTTVIISLAPCLDYVTGNSSTPTSGCCTQLSNVVRSQPQCLCAVVNGDSSSLGININRTQALTLPSACNIQTPPISRCYANSPTGSPANSSGNGSKNVPSTGGEPSNGSLTKLSFSLLVFLILSASYAQFSTPTEPLLCPF